MICSPERAGITHYRPSATLLSQLAVFVGQKVRCRVATSVYTFPLPTQPVYMLSMDSTRRESHAAARDAFQPLPTQKMSMIAFSYACIFALRFRYTVGEHSGEILAFW